ncbi:tRNA lysidine(34) synthetase TilS [bacterium]|nr:tRNA lysidine(34) synthetase TilS [bacterium]
MKNAVPVAKTKGLKDYEPVTPSALLGHLTRLQPALHYALAISGGADSAALMVLASQAAKLKKAPRFSVLTVDHDLRPESKEEVQKVSQWCQTLGLACHILKFPKALKTTGMQEHSRLQRYRVMAKWCRQNDAQALVVAHHRQDQAETVLMRLAHQSGINGLGGMAAKQRLAVQDETVTVVRPLLSYHREALLDVLKKAKQPWVEDPSNENPKFERVRARKALPALAELGLDMDALLALSAKMQALRATLDAQAVDWLRAHGRWTPFGYIDLDAEAFQALDATLQQRIISALMRFLGGQVYPPKRHRVDALMQRCQSQNYGAATLGGCLVRWRGAQLLLGREMASLCALPSHIVSQAGKRLWDARFLVNLTPSQAQQGVFVAPLGKAGLSAVKAQGATVNKQVPASYLHVLPAFFKGDEFLSCPVLQPESEFSATLAFEKTQFEAIFQLSADW